MPITFSSFGDVATVLQLAWQLRAALSDASGASAEIRALIVDVDSFTRALQQTRAAVEQRRTPLAPAIENGIGHAISACRAVLRAILGKVDAFRTRMTGRVGAAAWRQYWAVAAWSILGGKKDVDALRVRLSEQIGVVQTYLSLAQSNDQAKVQETVESQGVALDRIYSVMQDIQIRFDVGVPSFHFYDTSIGCYPPFARTSFQRLREQLDTMPGGRGLLAQMDAVVNRLNAVDGGTAILAPIVQSAWVCFEQRSVLKWHADRHYGPFFCIQLCIFRERAFGQLQALLGSQHAGRYPDIDVLKLPVERSHPVGSRCQCTIGPCRSQLDACIRQSNYWRPFSRARLLINQIEHLAMHWDPDHAASHKAACGSLVDVVNRTDRAFVQRSVLPLLRLHVECQRPSLSTIETICRSRLQLASTCQDYSQSLTSSPVFPRPSVVSLEWFSAPESVIPTHPLEWL